MDKRKDDLLKMKKAEYMDSYREKIVEMIGQIEDAWILNAIHSFIVGMTKEGG